MKILSEQLQRVYYIYECKVDGVVKYVGMGKGSRYQHCTSGASSCAELNSDFTLGKLMAVEIVENKLTEYEAKQIENDRILSYPEGQLYNKKISLDFRSSPNASKIKGITLNESPKDEEVLRLVTKINPDIEHKAFSDLLRSLNMAGISLGVASVGKTKILTLDKPRVTSFDLSHLGCKNWPHCGKYGCGN